jgi:hypothetical protein
MSVGRPTVGAQDGHGPWGADPALEPGGVVRSPIFDGSSKRGAVRATGAILSPVCRAGNPASVAGPGLAGRVGVGCRPQYQPGSGTNWVPVPRGVQYQLGPGGDQVLVPARSGADRVAVPTGRQYQAGPGTNRAAVPTGSQYQLVLRVVWITSRQGNKL